MRNAAHLENVLGIEADRRIAAAGLEFIQHGRNLRTEEGRNNRRRRFVGPQAVGVGGAHDGRLQQAVMLVHGRNHIHQEGNELQILRCGFTRTEQIDARIGSQRPVVVFARTVDSLERFFMQQHPEIMTAGDLVHDGHQQLVVVVGQVALLVHGSQFELIGCHLVVTGLDRNAQLQAFVFEIGHESDDPRGDRAEIVIFQLLVLGRFMPHERTARQHQVGTHGPKTFVHQEIFLLPTQILNHPVHLLVEIAAHLGRSLVHGRNRPQQRHFIIERLARIGNEDGRNTERTAHDEGRRGRVPRRITACLERIADTAVRKRRSVGLLLDKYLAGKFVEHTPAAVRLGKGVVLLGRTARERLKPMRIVVGTVVERPLAHSGSHAVGDFERQRRPPLHRIEQLGINRLVEIPAHGLAAEYLRTEILGRTSLGSLHFDGFVIDGRLHHFESEQ